MQFPCQTIVKSKNNHYFAHEENTKHKMSALCSIIKIQTFLRKTTKGAILTKNCSGYPRRFGRSPGCIPGQSAFPAAWLASGLGSFGVEMAVAGITA